MTGGGVNWGSAAFDPVNQILYANTSNAIHLVKLIPRTEAEDLKPPPGVELGPQHRRALCDDARGCAVEARASSATSRRGARWSPSI